MIVDCIADLHGNFPILPGGDLLIIAGDLTARDTFQEHMEFAQWIAKQTYKLKVIIAGNHDMLMEDWHPMFLTELAYLKDSGCEFEGLKIWGSPWTPIFEGVNPHCKAFMLPEKKLKKKWDKIPDNIDILVTHGPPHGILDSNGDECCGSISLRNATFDGTRFRKKKLHVFGHIHEEGGKRIDLSSGIFVNASIVNEHYLMVNEPVRVIL
jgi:Icc-related predicted phosphoesterase